MLKITIHDSAGELRFRLEGRLSGPWVNELRQSWQTAASVTSNRETTLDLSEVDFVDPDGQLLVAEMHRNGVRLVAKTPLIQALVDDISRTSQCATVEGKSPRRANVFVPSDTPGRNPRAL